MFTATNATQRYNRALPTATAFATATRYVTGAPRLGLGCKPGKGMRAALTARGMAPRLVQGWLNANARRHYAGLPLIWPPA